MQKMALVNTTIDALKKT